jgi:hypothetical protein
MTVVSQARQSVAVLFLVSAALSAALLQHASLRPHHIRICNFFFFVCGCVPLSCKAVLLLLQRFFQHPSTLKQTN